MKTVAEMLSEFHAAAGQEHSDGPDGTELRIRLQASETRELEDALRSGDLVAIASELADVVYVAYGTAHVLGVPLDLVIQEVHKANMRKFGLNGKPISVRADGKVLKPPGWQPADIGKVLEVDHE